MQIFGSNKNKLALLLYAEKILNEEEIGSNESIFQKKIKIEMTDEAIENVERIYDEIQTIKDKHDFINLTSFLTNLTKNIALFEESDQMSIGSLVKALKVINPTPFFKQTDSITKFNLLNNRDDVFISRFHQIVCVLLKEEYSEKIIAYFKGDWK